MKCKVWNIRHGATPFQVKRNKNLRSDVSFRIFPFERFPSFEKASASVSKSVSVLWSISLINVTSKRSRRGQSETRTRKCDSAVRSSVEVAASHPDRILFVVVFHGPAPIQGYRRSFRPYISFPYLSLSLSLSLSLFDPCPSRSGVVYQLQHAPAHPGDQYRPMSISRGRLFRMSLGERKRTVGGKRARLVYVLRFYNIISKCLFIY